MFPHPQQVAEALLAIDEAVIQHFGFEDIVLARERATVALVVQPHMVNSLKICHGGYLFSLADHALAYAAMSGNRRCATVSSHIAFHNPARLGDRLVAQAETASGDGKIVHGQVSILNQLGQTIATLQGVHYRSSRPIIEDSN